MVISDIQVAERAVEDHAQRQRALQAAWLPETDHVLLGLDARLPHRDDMPEFVYGGPDVPASFRRSRETDADFCLLSRGARSRDFHHRLQEARKPADIKGTIGKRQAAVWGDGSAWPRIKCKKYAAKEKACSDNALKTDFRRTLFFCQRGLNENAINFSRHANRANRLRFIRTGHTNQRW